MKMQPIAVISHAGRAFIPYGASDAGNMKMPTPMVLPTTRAVHITSPRARVRVSATGRAFLLGLAEIAGSDFGGHRLRFRRQKTRLLPAAPKERECEHGLTYRLGFGERPLEQDQGLIDVCAVDHERWNETYGALSTG